MPIFNNFMQEAVKGTRPGKFVVPEGMNMIAVNRKTGMAAYEGEPDTIMEAFKPGTGPADTFSVIGGLDQYVPPEEILKNSPQANQAVTSGSNGLF
ncbi:hypothetical protein D3C80_1870040 [compost metagenome]